jgi:DNA-binding HxlR family transcriptional regulator
MRRASFQELNCSVAQTLEVVGDWWSLLIVRDIYFGVTRFDDIQRRLGIARNTLTDRLNWLCEHGVVIRIPYGDSGNRFEYRLAEKGLDLQPVLLAMVAWGDKWGAAAKHPPLVPTDVNGDPVELRIVNTRTGRQVPRDKVRMLATKGATDPKMVPPPPNSQSRAARQAAKGGRRPQR